MDSNWILADSGARNNQTISKLLGHSNIATTAGYLDASSDYIEKRIKVAQRKWKQELLELEDE